MKTGRFSTRPPGSAKGVGYFIWYRTGSFFPRWLEDVHKGILPGGACRIMQTHKEWWLIWRFGTTLSNNIGHGTASGRPFHGFMARMQVLLVVARVDRKLGPSWWKINEHHKKHFKSELFIYGFRQKLCLPGRKQTGRAAPHKVRIRDAQQPTFPMKSIDKAKKCRNNPKANIETIPDCG